MKCFEKQRFERLKDFGTGTCVQDIRFVGCQFFGCSAFASEGARLRPHFQNLDLVKCSENACILAGAVIQDVLVDGLKTAGLLQTWACAFRHVTLCGKIDRVMFSNLYDPTRKTPQMEDVIAAENARFWSQTDWALDISEAEFVVCDIRGIPAKLIRRDPETQAVVTREKAIEYRKHHRNGEMPWDVSMDLIIEFGYADKVLVAGKRSKNFAELCRGLQELRRLGVAEPD